MKNLAHKISIAAFCMLGIVSVSTTAEAQKQKAKSTKARTTAKVKAKAPVQSNIVPNDAVVTPVIPVTAQNAVKDSLPNDSLPPMDGYYKSEMFNNAKAFNYPTVNSRDVKFYKRVWRDIDVNDPKNSLFNTPGATLAEIVLEGLRSGKLTAYEPSPTNGDSTFAKRISINDAMSRFRDSTLVDDIDPKTGDKRGSKMVLNDFNPASIVKFRTKEDIYFDKKRSMVVTRIIGIAPLKSYQASGAAVGEAAVFWLYFNQCRDFFATKDVSDPDRNLYDTTLDDIFLQRRYTSTIVRSTGSASAQRTTAQIASNSTLAGGGDAEKDRADNSKMIEAKINNFKANTWNYKMRTTATAAAKKAAKESKDTEKKVKINTDKTIKPVKQ